MMAKDSKVRVMPMPTGEFIEVTAGYFHQRLPLTIESIEVIETMLKVLKKQLQKEREGHRFDGGK
jgi:hypothetical protein